MKKRAYEYALSILKNRSQTHFQLEEKLKRKKYEPTEISETLATLQEIGLIDDERYAAAYARDKVLIYRRGRFRIGLELLKKGVSKEKINQATAAIKEEDELEAAKSLIESRSRIWKTLDDQARYRRTVSLLQRRGFSASIIRRALEN
jgi:regulatory protein